MFDTYAVPQSGDSNDKPAVDFDAMNKYVVETAKLENREVLVGYISGIVDLGTQEQNDAEVEFKGTEADEAAEIAKNSNTYFKDGIDQQTKKPVRLKCWPQKPIQSVAVSVDFPDIMIDKGQFFGESNPLPLRLWLGGQFYMEGTGMVIGRPIPLKVTNLAEAGQPKKWSFAANHSLYKIAVAAKLISPGDVFLPKNIDSLLGVSLQFTVQVFFKENKGKQYYTEYIQFSSGLGRKQEPLELVTEPFLIQFNQPNKDEALNNLRSHVINTIRRASNYEGSAIQKQLDAIKPAKARNAPVEGDSAPVEAEASQEAPKPAAAPERSRVVAPPADDFEDDIPF